RRWLHLRQERADHLRLVNELEVTEAAEKRGNHYTCNDETSAHCAFPRTGEGRFNRSPAARGERAEVQGSWTAGRIGSCKIRTCDPLVQLDSRSARNPQLRGPSRRKHARRLRSRFPCRRKLLGVLLFASRSQTF